MSTDPQIEQRFENVTRSSTFRNIVRTYGLDTKAVLDVGCSHGEFLAHFGPGSVGITVIEDEVAYGSQKGLDVRFGNVEDPAFELDRKFDVVFANNIFEHLYAPHTFLRTIGRHLSPGGTLILGVPCIPKLVWLSRFRKFRGAFATAHINFFTRDTLYHTMVHGGWKIEAMRGFRFSNPLVDHLLDPIYPHFYGVAREDAAFAYNTKRMRELAGYTHTP